MLIWALQTILGLWTFYSPMRFSLIMWVCRLSPFFNLSPLNQAFLFVFLDTDGALL